MWEELGISGGTAIQATQVFFDMVDVTSFL